MPEEVKEYKETRNWPSKWKMPFYENMEPLKDEDKGLCHYKIKLKFHLAPDLKRFLLRVVKFGSIAKHSRNLKYVAVGDGVDLGRACGIE